MKGFLIFLFLLLLAAIGAGAYFYLENENAQDSAKTLEEQNAELAFQVEHLEGRINQLNREFEERLAKASEEKEAEINKLAEEQDELVEELKDEIEKKEIEITQLADKLSVRLVDKVLFPSGEAEITAPGLKVLERVGNIIKTIEGKIIRVEGHTDNVPIHSRLKEDYPTNWELSTARATTVVRFLEETVGVKAGKLEAVGLSQFHPVASNKSSAGRSKNRRIEILLLPDKSGIKN